VYQGLLLDITPPGLEPNHTPTTSAEVENKWSNTSIPPHTFTVCTGELYLYTTQIINEIKIRSAVLKLCSNKEYVDTQSENANAAIHQ
jgi:hypothetical protein